MGHIASFVKYGIVGGSAALINWAVFYLGLQAGLQYLLARGAKLCHRDFVEFHLR